LVSQIAADMLLYDNVATVFTKRTPEVHEFGCKYCIQLKIELSEAVAELESTKEMIKILKEELDNYLDRV
jgi:hypothetical protein